MDGRPQREKVKNPREGANVLSALTFSWIFRTFWLGYRRNLEVSDLYSPLKEHTSSILGDKIVSAWEDELRRVNKLQKQSDMKKENNMNKENNSKVKVVEPSMFRVLVKCFGATIMINGIALAIMEIVFRMMQPVFLSYFLRYYSSDGTEVSKQEAYFYAGGVILCSAVNIFVIHPYMMSAFHTGMKMRIACCTLIYRKALKMSKTALGRTTVGQMVNLLSNDVSRFDMCVVFFHYLWIGPVEVAIVSYFMYTEVEISAMIGIAALLMFIPFQGFLGKRSSILRMKTAIRTDERVRLTNEIINGIQAIKMYAWEKPFSALVESARRREIDVLKSMSFIRGIIISFTIFATRFSIFMTLLAYVLFNNHVTAQKVFMLTAYYNILRQTMTIFVPQGISQLAEASVSIKRLQNFMMYEEISPSEIADGKENGEKPKEKINVMNEKTESNELSSGCVIVENGFAKWVTNEDENTLQNINIKINPGQLIAIVGHVGSGKTSILNVILGELPLHTGTVQINGNIVYACQEPWLFTGSVKQNILFGHTMDQRRYERVIKVCQLKRDFILLPYGDKTIVGERGISLSGGQRARINLARAVYAKADIYLLDDPLSAVDTHVGKHMFDECINGYLKGKTRILVTHQLQHLRNVDKVIVLKNGVIQVEGTYDELRDKGVDFGRLLNSQLESDDPSSAPTSRNSSRHASFTSLNSFVTNEPEPTEVEEQRSTGNVAGKVYAAYARAGGNWCVTFGVLTLCVMAQLAASAGDSFIATWVNMEERFVTVVNGTTEVEWLGPISRETCIYLYSSLTVLTVFLTLIRSSYFFTSCMRASRRLHDKMFNCISRATMYFFNINNSGRILNRFSKDMGAIDELLPTALLDCLQLGLSLLGIIVVVAAVNPWLMVPTVILGIIAYYLRVFYITTSRSIKRLEGVTRSPVFAHLNATLQGLTTIRAFDAGKLLTEEFDHHQDLHSSAWFIFLASSRAFGLWLDLVCLVYITMVTLSFLILPMGSDGTMDGGDVGLAITQSIGLTGMLQWGLRQTAELENQMTSVERVLDYSNLESEPPLESTAEKKPHENWPQEGRIKFEGVSMRYSVLESPVLKNLNFTINSREKVGIVGRTGAGKSSLISALFRLADLDGLIEIDGVDTSQIGLHDLRSKLSVIPQEPFLFSGSLRRNLDPFDSYGDNVLWQVLEEVKLKELGLDSRVADGGMNLSVGQRQLVCLARAIIRNNPILVLDEATANVDPQTDELIQMTIRRKFENCTVLTIAHRLNTVMDNDRILVMDAGTVVEFDHPHILVQKEGGYLRNMVQQTGRVMADILNTVAYDSYLRSTSTSL